MKAHNRLVASIVFITLIITGIYNYNKPSNASNKIILNKNFFLD